MWGILSGITTAILLVLFLVLIWWAASKHQKRRFDEAAQLALDPEDRSIDIEAVENKP